MKPIRRPRPVTAASTSSADSTRRCAEAVVDTSVLVVRLLRSGLRRDALAGGMTVGQLRGLAFLDEHPGACFADLAEHLTLGAPTTSKLVAAWVRRGLVRQSVDPGDRRRRTLFVTPRGNAYVRSGLRACRELMARRIAGVSARDRLAIRRAMRVLHPLVVPELRRTERKPQ